MFVRYLRYCEAGKNTLTVVNILKKDLDKYVKNLSVLNIIPINDEVCTLIIDNNLTNKYVSIVKPEDQQEQSEGVKNLNTQTRKALQGGDVVKNNVAIAAATTAYARIYMMPFKLDPSCAYSDTDSLFTKDESGLIKDLLDDKELGKFKDELGGEVFEEATFLGIKQYGYWYNENGERKERSIFAGVKRNSLSYEDITKLSQSENVPVQHQSRFFKSLNNLSIKIKTVDIHITKNNPKALINGKYVAPHVELLNNSSYIFNVKKALLTLRLRIQKKIANQLHKN